MAEKKIGEVFDYFAKVGVVALKLTGGMKIGDKIHIKGSTTDFVQEVKSIQIDKNPVEDVKQGDDVGLEVDDRVRKHDKVFLVE
ncbi:translation elongation factor-like protein [Candidatus Pacearchaeota archaeon CG10_big_fil_rev_8_21_14_0_10_35_219]|nr:translation elongation factor-like protein [Candidatus Pacearchaeota archaeon]OIO43486.1 MAG: hypothetical protein AUJ63_00075 [Candidatus Pacearchaeota archaeon CG1_02_35_32]PIO07608.1 MAG: translation elongation factor-like protein [Candidatus Pacearchaeota archaeon CG10_big_fil_rev_8_21_14_0_10_35_219]PIY81842.1 MAG: translation elongation factor-like protein [Candidatus Pacearchaeota archaeon CG_4_10_14_0_8_um_filter_35_169]PIZ80708.1 MAG: translation elongation factor-like protein [Cand